MTCVKFFSLRHALRWNDGFKSVGEVSKVRDSCGCGESGSVIRPPEVGTCSLVPRLYFLAFFSLILLRAKKSWEVEPGNEARDMIN